MKGLASAFLDLFNKTPKLDKSKGVYRNGVDNNYPELVESLITNSVTALRCKNLMASYISAKGFGREENKTIVHPGKGTTLLKFLQEVADSIAEQNGVFIQVNYNAAHDIIDMDVLPYTDCRLGKKDDDNYSGKIGVCSDWNDRKIFKKARKVDVFNPNPDVIDAQAEEAGGFDKYNGQILYFKNAKYTYPLSLIHPCLEDCDSEKRASLYKNSSLRKGFFGKTMVVTKPLIDPVLDRDDTEYQEQKESRSEFRKTIQQFVGAENSDGVMHVEMEFTSDKLEDEIMFKNIESNIDDNLFAHTENSVADNIRMCFNNVPSPLIHSNDGAMFGSSGEAIKAMKEFYQDQTNDERMNAEQIVNRLMSRFKEPMKDLKIEKLIKQENADNETGNSEA